MQFNIEKDHLTIDEMYEAIKFENIYYEYIDSNNSKKANEFLKDNGKIIKAVREHIKTCPMCYSLYQEINTYYQRNMLNIKLTSNDNKAKAFRVMNFEQFYKYNKVKNDLIEKNVHEKTL